jgi:protein-S-isoprenylcysteine O-methyltransferase Ste14
MSGAGPRGRRYLRARWRDALVYWLWLPAAVLLAGRGVDRLLRLPPLPAREWLAALATALLLSGCIWIWRAERDLKRLGGGTPNPRFPARRLVTAGSYGWCRHPMFFGYDLAALGVVLLCRSLGMLLVAFPVFIALQVLVLRKEERILEKRFGAEFVAYRQRVPLLLPRPPRPVRR